MVQSDGSSRRRRPVESGIFSFILHASRGVPRADLSLSAGARCGHFPWRHYIPGSLLLCWLVYCLPKFMQAAADLEVLKRSCYCAASEWLTASRFLIHHCPTVIFQQFISHSLAVARISTFHRNIVVDKGHGHSEGLRMTMCTCITHEVQKRN